MFVFCFVKRSAAGQRCNSRGQLMSHTDVERADAVAADAAADAASFAAGALAVAAAVENGDVVLRGYFSETKKVLSKSMFVGFDLV